MKDDTIHIHVFLGTPEDIAAGREIKASLSTFLELIATRSSNPKAHRYVADLLFGALNPHRESLLDTASPLKRQRPARRHAAATLHHAVA